MTKSRRFIAVILCTVLILCCASFVQADTPLTEEEISLVELNNVSVNLAVNNYFSQRHNYLLGNSDSIASGNVPLNNDEAEHRAAMTEIGIVRNDMQITVSCITLADTSAEAVVSEVVTYQKNGIDYTETVEHILTIYPGDELTIAADAYYETACNFVSCSYTTINAALANTVNTGSGLCIIHVAEGEIGYAETGTNITKYGEWYGGNGQPWCAMFVSWCAEQADIATSVITKNWGCDEHMNHFRNQGRFHKSIAYSGNTTPQAGDIIFFGSSQADSTHMGIVVASDATNVYYIDGNGSNNDVRSQYCALTTSSILGYGRPNYASTTHTYSMFSDASTHWQVCSACGHTTTADIHNSYYKHNATYHWVACSDCGWESTTRNRHILILGGIGQPSTCRVCDYVSYGGTLNSIIHNLQHEVS